MAILTDNRMRTMRLSRVVPHDEERTKFAVSHRCSLCKHEETRIVDLEHLDAQLRDIYHCKEEACPTNRTS